MHLRVCNVLSQAPPGRSTGAAQASPAWHPYQLARPESRLWLQAGYTHTLLPTGVLFRGRKVLVLRAL